MNQLSSADDETRAIIRYPSRLHYEAKRLAKADGVSLNTILKRSVEREICRSKNMKFIDKYIDNTTYLLFGINIEELREKIHESTPLNVYQRVYLASILPPKKRERLFLLEWPKDLDEISMIDEVMDNSIEERAEKKYYNINKIANNFRVPLSILGQEYLKTMLKEKSYNEIMRLTKHLYIDEDEEEGPTEAEELTEEEVKDYEEEDDIKIIKPRGFK